MLPLPCLFFVAVSANDITQQSARMSLNGEFLYSLIYRLAFELIRPFRRPVQGFVTLFAPWTPLTVW